MQKKTPTLGNLLVIAIFVLACFGLFLFLWYSFGGPVPLRPKGYRVRADFPNGLQLAEQSDVRIAGVPVGRVVTVKEHNGYAEAVMEIESRYAPLPRSIHAILREKTILGETYVQLIPHNGFGPPYIPDEGRLPQQNVEKAVTLDEVLETFNPHTREEFRRWQQTWANAFRGRGEDINAFFAELEPFTAETNKILRLLAAQEAAVSALVRNTGQVFAALAGRERQLEALIKDGERTFAAAAAASNSFAQTFRALPPFERSSTRALKELDTLAAEANPYLIQFRADERQLAPTLQALKAFSPPLERFLVDTSLWAKAAKRGLPAFDRSLELTVPVLRELVPILRNFNPFFEYLGSYEPELQAFFANATAVTEAAANSENNKTVGGERPRLHYIRAMAVLSPEGLAIYKHPLGISRTNPYFHPGAFNQLASGLPVYNSSNCSESAPALIGPPNEYVSEAVIKALRGEPFELIGSGGERLSGQIQPVVNRSPNEPNHVGAPPCRQQEPFTFDGTRSDFPHVAP
jgi:phospholipid/cholesterol/gamma-HCH transport system substrate-binding protein